MSSVVPVAKVGRDKIGRPITADGLTRLRPTRLLLPTAEQVCQIPRAYTMFAIVGINFVTSERDYFLRYLVDTLEGQHMFAFLSQSDFDQFSPSEAHRISHTAEQERMWDQIDWVAFFSKDNIDVLLETINMCMETAEPDFVDMVKNHRIAMGEQEWTQDDIGDFFGVIITANRERFRAQMSSEEQRAAIKANPEAFAGKMRMFFGGNDPLFVELNTLLRGERVSPKRKRFKDLTVSFL
tara:strand:- start:10558 stop:11274 length:717 start_codon:yes stop_codon:yes gene_type:complete